MNSEAFAAWSSLFDEGVKTVWLSECKELKSAAMALYALKRELKKVESTFEAKLNSYKERLLNQSCDRVENVKRKIFPLVKPTICTSLAIPQPVLDCSLKDTSDVSELDQAITEADIESSDNDITNVITSSTSPKLTKNPNILKRKKATPQLTPSVLNFSTRNQSTSSIDSDASLNLLHINKTPKKAVGVLDFLDSSIIENTPILNKTRKRKKKDVSKEVHSRNATLTQMFGNCNDTTFAEGVPPVGAAEACAAADADAAEDDGSMFLDEILDYINRDNEQEAAGHRKDGDLAAGKKQGSYPVQKCQSPNYMYKPKPVRGKARMDLPGWSCKQCRDFYEALGLSEDELKVKMDECSKHRSKFPPVDDTPPGFWDMTLPSTPATFYE